MRNMYKNSLIKKFKKSDLYNQDFPYIIIENALDEDFYNKLSAEFPKLETFSNTANINENTRYDIFNESYTGESEIWREFLEYHSSAEFFSSVISIFKNEIKNSKNQNLVDLISKKDLKTGSIKKDFKDKKIDIWHPITISINTRVSKNKPSVRTPHLDNPNKIYGGLFYMRNPKDNCKGGNLELYKFKNKKKYNGNSIPTRFLKKISTVDYKENSLILFLNSGDSIHGVTQRSATDYSRRFLYFTAASHDVSMHDTTKNQIHNFEKFFLRAKQRFNSVVNRI